MPFTCHGADLILPPAFPHGGQGGADPVDRGRYPSTGRGGAPTGCPGPDFFRFAVNTRLRNGGSGRVGTRSVPRYGGTATEAHAMSGKPPSAGGPNGQRGRAPQSAFNLGISRVRHARAVRGRGAPRISRVASALTSQA